MTTDQKILAGKWRIAKLKISGTRSPHGTRSRYNSGCHCFQCRVANTNYETQRAAKHRDGWHNRLVGTDAVISHIENLALGGVGYKALADAAGVSRNVMARIKYRQTKRVREDTQARILAVNETTGIADHSLIDAGPTRALIGKLVRDGYTRVWIARQLGYKTAGLQFRFPQTTALNASRVERLYRRIQDGRVSR